MTKIFGQDAAWAILVCLQEVTENTKEYKDVKRNVGRVIFMDHLAVSVGCGMLDTLKAFVQSG